LIEETMRRSSIFASASPLVLFSLALAASARAQAPQPDSADAPAPPKPETPAPGAAKPAPKTQGPDAAKPAAKSSASVSLGLPSGKSSSPGAAPAADAREERDRSLEETNSMGGATGLLRTVEAGSGAAGTFRLHLLADWFTKSSFLCSPDYPCPIAPNATADAASRIGSSIGLSVTPLEFLEAFAAIRSYSNSDDRNRPDVFQVIGDANMGVKAFTPNKIGQLVNFGGAADLLFRGASGGTGMQGDATSMRLRALGTFDLRKPANEGLPLRIHANLGYLLDNSGQLAADVEEKRKLQHDPRGRKITRVERFGLNINRMDQILVGVGVEGMFPQVRPFAEYNLGIPANRQGYNCDPNFTTLGDQCMGGGKRGTEQIQAAGFSSLPSTLTLGLRFFPWLRGLQTTAAFDIGTTGTSAFVEELAPAPVWDLWFGVGYAFDTEEPAAKVAIEKVVVPPRAELKIRGFVHEKDKQDPISDAIVRVQGRDLSGMATDPDGRFLSPAVDAGSYTLTVRADRFKDGQCAVTIVAPPEPEPEVVAEMLTVQPPPVITDVDCVLEPVPSVGSVSGRILDADGMAPVVGATVKIADSKGKELGSAVTDSIGAFSVDGLAPGAVTVKVEATDYMAHAQTAEIKIGQDDKSDVLVQKRPAKGDVEVAAKEIKIKKQILFETDSARINPASTALVEEIADVMNRNPLIKRIEIQGHTDNTGSKDHNKTLSDQRAKAVRDALVSLGVKADRLTAVGYGQEKSIASNANAQGREKNRRVQFIILEQDKPGPAKPSADKPSADKASADEPSADKAKPAADKAKPAAKP
jgi:OmpA-OmpF porin, OOP family